MKTLLLCNLAPRKLGAYEQVVTAIGRELSAAGDAYVAAFSAAPIPEVADGFAAAGVRWTVIPGWCGADGEPRPWAVCGPARQLVRAERPDVVAVHFGNELPALAVWLAGRVTGNNRAAWVWEQDQQIQPPSALTARLSRIGLVGRCFARVVAVYEGGRRSLRERGVPDGKIAVIRNAVGDHPPARPRGWLRQELGVPASAALIATVGSLIPRKRLDLGIRALGTVSARGGRQAHLVVVGDGGEYDRLKRLAAGLQLAGQVHLLGLRQDVRDVLAEADLLLHTSLAETCTYAVTEAMCAGIPAVVTEAGAAREQIADGESGFVVARDDFAGLCDRLAVLVGDADLRRSLGRAARARWQAHYQLADAARGYAMLYRSLVRA